MGDNDVVVPVLLPELRRLDGALEGGREMEDVARTEALDRGEVGECQVGLEMLDAGRRLRRQWQPVDRQDIRAGGGQPLEQLPRDHPGSAGHQDPLPAQGVDRTIRHVSSCQLGWLRPVPRPRDAPPGHR